MAGSLQLRALYAIAATPRTGSNYLCELLHSAELGNPDEYLSPVFPLWGERNFNTPETLFRRRSQWDVFGIKLFWEHREAQHLVADFDELHPDMKWIFLRRRDIESQARSWMTALERGEWNSTSQPYLEAFNGEVELFVRKIERHNREWDRWFTEKYIRPMNVWFEDLIEYPDGQLSRIKQFILA